MGRILLGILITIGGFFFTWKSEWFLNNFGRVDWAEQHLGLEGGSRLFYKFFGVMIIVLGLFIVSGLWYNLLNGIASLFKL